MKTENKKWIGYETTNTLTGEKYAGIFSYTVDSAEEKHKRKNYIGAGIVAQGQAEKYRRQSEFTKNVIKHGYENFTRKDLAFFNTEEEALAWEASYIDEAYIGRHNVLNRLRGGNRSNAMKGTNLGEKHPYAKKIMDVTNCIIYDCVKEASEDVGIKYNTLYSRAKSKANKQWQLL